MMGRKYTSEEQDFFIQYVSGHSYKEIQEKFNSSFFPSITMNQVKSYITNHKLNTGKTGRFEKGFTPYNKGIKGVCSKGSEKTWFPKGNVPINHKPVGSERIDSKDGYILVKVAEPNKWKFKHRVIWESIYGDIPHDHVVIFRDGNKLNTCIDNLMLVSRKLHAVMNSTGLCVYKDEFKDTAIAIAELKIGIVNAKRSKAE